MVLHVGGILFDIDGTLVDSSAAVERSWRTWAREYHVDADEVVRVCHGRRTEDVVPQFVSPQHQAAAVARELALELADLDGVVALPGSRQVLDALPRQRWAAVTSGERSLMTSRLEASGPCSADSYQCRRCVDGKAKPGRLPEGGCRVGFSGPALPGGRRFAGGHRCWTCRRGTSTGRRHHPRSSGTGRRRCGRDRFVLHKRRSHRSRCRCSHVLKQLCGECRAWN
jgi:Haloacid dehalogenase-like hydrolase